MAKRKMSNQDIIAMAQMMIEENKTCEEMAKICGIGTTSVNRYINCWLPNIDTELYLKAKKLMIQHDRMLKEYEKTGKFSDINYRIKLYEDIQMVCTD